MVQKLPPPPQFSSPELQPFNRWLVELTAILGNSGGVNPITIDGYPQLVTQVGDNTTDIAALQNTVAGQSLQISSLVNAIAVINASITTLSARGELLFGAGAPAAGLGKVNDWYGDTAGAAGARVWIKKAPGVWTAFPF